MKRTLLALSALVVCTQASFNPIQTIKNKLFKKEQATLKGDDWPAVHWPKDFETHGTLYTWNATSQELEIFAHTTLDEYIDATGNREKIITHMDLPGVGLSEIITFVDANTHKAYQNIQKINKCTVYDLPESFNLTELINTVSDKNSNATTYLGVKSVPWAKDSQFHAFNITVPNLEETVYFCTKTKEVKWVHIEANGYILGAPGGAQDRVFTDADFDGAACTPQSDKSAFIANPKRRILF